LAVLPNGSGRLTGTLTGEAAAVWTTILDTLARPVTTDDDQSDRRSPAQRRHDALLEAGRRLLRSGSLPDCGGAPATVLVTLTVDQLQARTGLATAGHGGLITISEALRIAAEADIIPVVVGDAGGVLSYGLRRRVASIGQRRALAARDRGCSFPTCDRPPDWCESHHVTPWVDGGPTDLDNLTLLCGFHGNTRNVAGRYVCAMGCQCGSHPAGSTELKLLAGTPPITWPSTSRHPPCPNGTAPRSATALATRRRPAPDSAGQPAVRGRSQRYGAAGGVRSGHRLAIPIG